MEKDEKRKYVEPELVEHENLDEITKAEVSNFV